MSAALPPVDLPAGHQPAAAGPQEPGPPRSGDLCPVCKKGQLDYNGLLVLACPECGYSLGGCFT